MNTIGLDEPADLGKPWAIDLGQMRAGVEAVVAGPAAESLPGVQLVDPRAERLVDMVVDVVAAATQAQAAPNATAAKVRAAALGAIIPGGGSA